MTAVEATPRRPALALLCWLAACSAPVDGAPVDAEVGSGDAGADVAADAEGDAADDASVDVADEAPFNQVAAGVYALEGYATATNYDDLAPLGELVGEAEVVGLGESVHLSGGFLRTKARLMRYLIEVKGFRVIAYETEWTDAVAVDDYLARCEGDANAIARQHIRPTWHDRSLGELLAWACAFNQAHPGERIRFFGFNNFQPWVDFAALAPLIDAYVDEDPAGLRAGLERCEGVSALSESQYFLLNPRSTPIGAEDYRSCTAALDRLEALLSDQRGRLGAELSEEALRWLDVHLISLRGWEDYRWGSNPEGFTPATAQEEGRKGADSRDLAMATIFAAFRELRFAGQKIVFSSHNSHLQTGSITLDAVYPALAAELDYMEGTTRMGDHLRAALGDAFIPIGLFAYRYGVTTEWLPLRADTQPDAPPADRILEARLHALGVPSLLVDLEAAAGGDPPLVQAGQPYLVGGPDVDPRSGGWIIVLYEAVPRALLRAIVFVDEAEPWEQLEAE